MTFVSCSHWGMFPTDPGKLERVARAVCKEMGRDPDKLMTVASDPSTPPWQQWEHFVHTAKAAIRAYERYDGRERSTDWELVV